MKTNGHINCQCCCAKIVQVGNIIRKLPTFEVEPQTHQRHLVFEIKLLSCTDFSHINPKFETCSQHNNEQIDNMKV